jgi:hypothetical protein
MGNNAILLFREDIRANLNLGPLIKVTIFCDCDCVVTIDGRLE